MKEDMGDKAGEKQTEGRVEDRFRSWIRCKNLTATDQIKAGLVLLALAEASGVIIGDTVENRETNIFSFGQSQSKSCIFACHLHVRAEGPYACN